MKETNTHIYFYTEIYSNWNRCSFKDPLSQITFSNSEQCFMWYKATFFQDFEIAAKIANTPHPKENKGLGRLIKDYDDKAWECVRLGYMVYANYLKFSQNEDYKKELISTGNKILVEASPYDKIWGVGLDENNIKILNKETWEGLNLLGVALEKVRNLLK